MSDLQDIQKYPELMDPPFLYNPRIDRRRAPERESRAELPPSDNPYGADLVALQQEDPDSYRMVIYSWA